ncbi:hypothetical protein ACQY0O_005772 [Thecaphora frezii]
MATLNVKDALSYLDQVKVQFAEHPDVYNRFLDIMKDFKSQSIDTPGVIERVSTLFRGHPSLIQGFNTFLPPGYRIECSLDPSESNLITVTTPTGTTTQTPGGVGIAGAINRMSGAGMSSGAAGAAGPGGGPPPQHAPASRGGPQNLGAMHAPAGGARHAEPPVPPPPQHPQHPHHPQYPPHEAGPPGMGYGVGGGPPNMMPHGQGGAGYPGAPPAQGLGPMPGPGQQHLHAGGHGGPHGHGHGGHGHGPAPMGGMAGPHHPHGRPQSPLMGPGGPGAPSTPNQGPAVLPHAGRHGGPSPHGPPASMHDAKRPPVEFNHAINYVNKIKQRFSGDPDTYKQFLELLQTYQKEQRPIHDVYAQVTILFDNAKDLLDEFKQFLPDTNNGTQPTSGLFNMLGQVTSNLGGPAGGPPPPAAGAAGGVAVGLGVPPGGMRVLPPDVVGPAPDAAVGGSGKKGAAAAGAVSGATSQPSGRKKRAAGTNETGKTGTGKTKKSKHHHKTEQRTPPLRPEPLPASPTYGHPAQVHRHHAYGPDGLVVAEAAGLVPPGTTVNGLAVGQTQAPLATIDEVAFFDRVKKHIDDRATYLEFLKLLNLYSQDIIDVRTLVERAGIFIGGHRELYAAFKGLCGYDMGKHGWLDAEDPIVENVPASLRERVDLSTCKVYGVSYRKLPKSEVNLACSGRDPMCWEVLNDVWVSHPTWASEGESFNPHKKNPYEDALYRSEEERHEYDYHIEANLRTIALLEPIAARISTMDNDERASFRLKPGLGGQSKSIYQRVIKKVYGREQGLEIINALHDNPCVSVPIVLHRLKQKDEEWKRAQREWNKVWREVDARNFYKSLDHQGVNFKASDKKAITAKAFVAEIEARKIQQQQRRLALDPELPRPRPRHQLVYVMDDLHVLADVLKLAFSFLDRATGSYSAMDRERIESFLRSFVPKLLELESTDFEELLNGDVELDDDDDGKSHADDDSRSEGTTPDDDLDSSSSSSPSGANGKKGKKQQADLRRKILKNQAETSKQNGEAGDEVNDVATPAASTTSPAIAADVDSAAEALANQSSNPATAAAATDIEMAEASASSSATDSAATATADAADQTDQADKENAEGGGNVTTMDEDKDDADEEEPGRKSGPATWINTDLTNSFDSRKGQTNSLGEGAAVERRHRGMRQLNFFCNTTYFVFARLLQLLYSRLHRMKTLGADMAAREPLRSKINPIAVELGLQDGASGPAAVVGATANASSLGPVASTNEEAGLTLHPSRYYDTLLDMCEKLFDGDIDQATFEESVRYMYGIEGYIVFTLDKVIGALVKTVQALTTDSKCQELQSILERDRADPNRDVVDGYRHQIANRMAAEAAIGKDENLFRIEWVPSTSTLLIQMLSRDDLTLDDARNAEHRWLQYISSYSLWMPTEGLPVEAQAPFLKRICPANATLENDAEGTRYITRSGLEIRVCIRTYKLFFVHDSEDTFIRLRPQSEIESIDAQAKVVKAKRTQRFSKWLERRRRAIDYPGSLGQEDDEAMEAPDSMQTDEAASRSVAKGDSRAEETRSHAAVVSTSESAAGAATQSAGHADTARSSEAQASDEAGKQATASAPSVTAVEGKTEAAGGAAKTADVKGEAGASAGDAATSAQGSKAADRT